MFFFGKSGAKNEKAQATKTSVARVKQQEAVRKDFKQCKSLGSRPFFQREKNCFVGLAMLRVQHNATCSSITHIFGD